MKNEGRWICILFFLFVFYSAVQLASAGDMIPRAESVRNLTDEFSQAWRLQASRIFDEPRQRAANHIVSYLLLAFLIGTLFVLFHLIVKWNHMERTAGRIRSGMLSFYTRMWLISRWGYRY